MYVIVDPKTGSGAYLECIGSHININNGPSSTVNWFVAIQIVASIKGMDSSAIYHIVCKRRTHFYIVERKNKTFLHPWGSPQALGLCGPLGNGCLCSNVRAQVPIHENTYVAGDSFREELMSKMSMSKDP